MYSRARRIRRIARSLLTAARIKDLSASSPTTARSHTGLGQLGFARARRETSSGVCQTRRVGSSGAVSSLVLPVSLESGYLLSDED